MIDSDDRADPVLTCPSCGWRGYRSQTADDSPPGEPPNYVCPLCGGDLPTHEDRRP